MFLLLLAAVLAQAASGPDAGEIMRRVAANQERAAAARSAWVYEQSVLVRMKRPNGRLAREEVREFVVTPKADGVERELKQFRGKVDRNGNLVEYSDPNYEHKEIDIDGELARDLSQDFSGDSGSKDGVGRELFPLTGKEQEKYAFSLHGTETYRDREVYRIRFQPRRDGTWAGEALIDAQEFQPVLVTTALGKSIPLAVKTLLGTDIKQLGFKITYQKVADGLWFPAAWGGEFCVRGVFFYKRRISISVANRGFQQAEITSKGDV
jgi:hypothetical protein